jgi:DNA-binding response OmpR family regulator
MVSIVADRERGLAAGAADYVAKPFVMTDLIQKVRRLTG